MSQIVGLKQQIFQGSDWPSLASFVTDDAPGVRDNSAGDTSTYQEALLYPVYGNGDWSYCFLLDLGATGTVKYAQVSYSANNNSPFIAIRGHDGTNYLEEAGQQYAYYPPSPTVGFPTVPTGYTSARYWVVKLGLGSVSYGTTYNIRVYDLRLLDSGYNIIPYAMSATGPPPGNAFLVF